MISWANPSSSPANSPRRFTNKLYAMTDGTATASPPTAIPMNASITPNTVPSSPRSGLTEPNVASHGRNRAAASRSAATSFASTIRRASSCVVVSAVWVATAGPRRPLDLGHETVCLAPHPAELPPLEEDEVPGDDGKHDEDGEHELGLAARREDQFPGRCRNRPAHLKEHPVSPP